MMCKNTLLQKVFGSQEIVASIGLFLLVWFRFRYLNKYENEKDLCVCKGLEILAEE